MTCSRVLPFFSTILPLVLISSCIPGFLEKYTQEGPTVSQTKDETTTETPSPSKEERKIQLLRPNQYLIASPYQQVWDGVLSVLMENYSLTIVDEKSGIIATEWDKYYRHGRLYRNKVTLRLVRNGSQRTELTVQNSLEQMKAQNSLQNEWVPTSDQGEEAERIVRNTATVLALPLEDLKSNYELAKKPTQQPL